MQRGEVGVEGLVEGGELDGVGLRFEEECVEEGTVLGVLVRFIRLISRRDGRDYIPRIRLHGVFDARGGLLD